MNIRYSVDMIRFHVMEEGERIESFFNRIQYRHNVKYYEKFGHKDYRHNWHVTQVLDSPVIGYSEFSYWVGYQQNMEKPNGKKSLVIEYNPNKCPMLGELLEIMQTFFIHNKHLTLRQADIACDIPIDTDKIIVDKADKKNYKVMCYDGNKTTYIGEGNGRIKIYNKQKELNKREKDTQLTPLTRYEVTIKYKLEIPYVLQLTNLELNLANCYSVDLESLNNDSSDVGKTMSVHLYALMSGYPINEMSRKYKNRVREILEKGYRIPIENKNILAVTQEYLKNLIENLE